MNRKNTWQLKVCNCTAFRERGKIDVVGGGEGTGRKQKKKKTVTIKKIQFIALQERNPLSWVNKFVIQRFIEQLKRKVWRHCH